MKDLMSSRHPTTQASDFTVVESTEHHAEWGDIVIQRFNNNEKESNDATTTD